MPQVIIIGDGPAGLSAALFLAKKHMDVLVLGQDETPMHAAKLFNYLGIPEITGSDFQQIARQQVAAQGARLEARKAAAITRGADGFTVQTEDGRSDSAKYVILAAGFEPALAKGVGLSLTPKKVVEADRNGRTAVDNFYAVGWSVRPDKIQAIISAGDGAAAALDILSKEAGKDIHDFDVVEK